MLLNPLNFHSPKTLPEAAKLYASLENVKIKAGGTFLLNALKLMKRKGSKTPENVISLNKIDELKGISINGGKIIIKAMTTIDELFESGEVIKHISILHAVCRNISTQPIRNMATLGGNLTCRYTWTEMPAVMIGLGATMHFMDEEGNEHSLPAEEFYKNAAKTDKIFTHVTIDYDKKAAIAYRRIKKSQFVDIPLLSLLIRTNFAGNKFTNTVVSVNNCVDFAQRDSNLENFLNQSTCSSEIADAALDHITADIYEKRSTDYKKYMFKQCLKSAINELVANQRQ